MFNLILTMLAGIVAGFLLSSPRLHRVSSWVVSITIYALLLLLGMGIGRNPDILSGLSALGGTALLMAAAGISGSILVCWLLWKFRLLPPPGNESVNGAAGKLTDTSESSEVNPALRLLKSLSGSALTLAFLMAGIALGLFIPGEVPGKLDACGADPEKLVLYAMMIAVGLSLGSNPDFKDILKGLRPGLLLLPLGTIAGTLLFSCLASLLIGKWPMWDCAAIGSGMGYYSLSSVLIGSLKEATLGTTLAGELATIALLSNVFRELASLLLAPLFRRIAGPYAPIASAGATAMDVCFPVITRCCGDAVIPAIFIGGVLCDFSVPFLVSFFCSLS